MERRNHQWRGLFPFMNSPPVDVDDPASPLVTPGLEHHVMPLIPMGYSGHIAGLPIPLQLADFRGLDFYQVPPAVIAPPPSSAWLPGPDQCLPDV